MNLPSQCIDCYAIRSCFVFRKSATARFIILSSAKKGDRQIRICDKNRCSGIRILAISPRPLPDLSAHIRFCPQQNCAKLFHYCAASSLEPASFFFNNFNWGAAAAASVLTEMGSGEVERFGGEWLILEDVCFALTAPPTGAEDS